MKQEKKKNETVSSVFLTGVLGMLWLPGPSGVEFSEDVDSWRVRGLWRDECMLASVGQGLLESRKSLGDAGGQETCRFRRLLGFPLSHDKLHHLK